MILEHALRQVRTGGEVAFDAATVEAKPPISAFPVFWGSRSAVRWKNPASTCFWCSGDRSRTTAMGSASQIHIAIGRGCFTYATTLCRALIISGKQCD
jgi:hypothetical protein